MAYGTPMLRSVLLLSSVIAALTACSPAEPPLLIDGAQAPATNIAQAPPAEPTRSGDANAAISR